MKYISNVVRLALLSLVFVGAATSAPQTASAQADLTTNELRILTPMAQGGNTFETNLETQTSQWGPASGGTTVEPVDPPVEADASDLIKRDTQLSLREKIQMRVDGLFKKFQNEFRTLVFGEKAFATPGSTIVVPNATANVGDKMHIFAKIINTGTAPAVNNFWNEFSYQWNSTAGAWTAYPVTNTHAQLPVTGKAVDGINAIVPNGSGTLYIRHCLDIYNNVPEISDDNCTISTGIDVSAAPSPDLVSQNLTLSSGPYTQGTPITLNATVRNNGTVSTNVGFSDDFTYQWNGTSGTWNSFTGNTVNKAALGAGATSGDGPVSFTPAQGGTLYIQHCVDSTHVIPEGANETPNCTVSAGVVVAPAECGFTTIDNCELDTMPSGGTDGTCSLGYVGTCSATCNSGTWGMTSNNCHLPVVDVFQICTYDRTICAQRGQTMLVAPGAELVIDWATYEGDYCSAVSGEGFVTGGEEDGSIEITASAVSNDVERYQIACNYQDGIPADAWIDVATLEEEPVLRSDKTTVKAGDTAMLEWDTNNGDEGACTLTGGGVNGNDILQNGSGTNETGEAEVTISGRTTFILTCGPLSAVKTIEIIPTGWEA